MFGLIRKWKRRRLARRDFPRHWDEFLTTRVPFVASLDQALAARFRDYLKLFVWEKAFIGAGGLEITDEVKVVISAAAVRLILHLDYDYYDRLTEIVVYPSHYTHPDKDDAIVFGEAHNWGTVVLSWDAVVHGLANTEDGHDTATHEFAHVLDRGTGAFDGTPELRSSAHYRPWAEIMSRHFLKLRAGQRDELRVLREYGATNEAEFFAVATESFFERPSAMAEKTPELYRVLCEFYGFDPARRS